MEKNSNLYPPEIFFIFAFSNWVRAARASCSFRWQTSFVAKKTRRHRNVTIVCTFARSYIFEYIMPVSEFMWFREKSKIIVNIYCKYLRIVTVTISTLSVTIYVNYNLTLIFYVFLCLLSSSGWACNYKITAEKKLPDFGQESKIPSVIIYQLLHCSSWSFCYWYVLIRTIWKYNMV